MVTETPNLDVLLPERYPEHDLFVCDVADAVIKDIMQHMEHPFYSLSKKPETKIRRYEHGANYIEVIPSVKGLATIYDKDILIYAVSQIMAKLKRGEKVSKRIRISCHDLLMFTNRGQGGKDYAALCEAIDRLAGTRIKTNIRTGDEEEIPNFGLIDEGTVRRKQGLDGRIQWVELVLSDWIFRAIRQKEVLTLHPDYFRLRKPLERRIYELARKHAGQQSTWSCRVDTLRKKSGSKSPLKHFRYLVKEMVANDHLPDYRVEYDEDADKVVFINRNTMKAEPSGSVVFSGFLKPETYEAAKESAPGWDVYHLEAEWRDWMSEPPRDADAAFIGFCRKWSAKRGAP